MIIIAYNSNNTISNVYSGTGLSDYIQMIIGCLQMIIGCLCKSTKKNDPAGVLKAFQGKNPEVPSRISWKEQGETNDLLPQRSTIRPNSISISTRPQRNLGHSRPFHGNLVLGHNWALQHSKVHGSSGS